MLRFAMYWIIWCQKLKPGVRGGRVDYVSQKRARARKHVDVAFTEHIKSLRAYPRTSLDFGKFSAAVSLTPSDSLEPFRAHNPESWLALGTCDDPTVAFINSDPCVYHCVFHRRRN